MSTCLGGAFLGSLFSGWIADGVGRRRAFQLCALPMIIGAVIRCDMDTLNITYLTILIILIKNYKELYFARLVYLHIM